MKRECDIERALRQSNEDCAGLEIDGAFLLERSLVHLGEHWDNEVRYHCRLYGMRQTAKWFGLELDTVAAVARGS